MNIPRSSARVFVAKAGNNLIVFLGIIFFARELGSHQIGIFFLFQAVIGIISIPADFAISSGLTKRISEGGDAGSLLSTAIILKAIFLIPIAFGILFFQNVINVYIGADIAIYMSAALIIKEFAKLSIQVLKGELRVGEISGPLLSRKIVFVGIGAFLIILGYEYKALIYGFISGLLTMLIYGIWKSSTHLAPPSIKHVRSLLNYSKYAFISSVGGYFYSWMDVAIIGFFLTQTEVGIYEVAWRVTAVVMLFSQPIATTIFPQVSQWKSNDAIDRIESMLPKAIMPPLFFAIPAFFGVAIFSREILGLVFGSEYTAGWLVLIILMGEKVIQSVHIILGRSLQGIDRPDLAAKAGIVAMFINLVLNIIFVVQYGIVGAAIATALSFVANSLLHAYYLSLFVPIRIPYAQIGGCTIAGLGMAVTLSEVSSIIVISNLPRLALFILSGVAVYGVFALIIPQTRKLINDYYRMFFT